MRHAAWLGMLMLTAALSAAPPAHAQGTLTLYGGGRASSGLEVAVVSATDSSTATPPEVKLKDSAMVGLAIGWMIDGQRDGEVLLTRQSSRLRTGTGIEVPVTLTSAQLGGVFYWSDEAMSRGPYAAGGLGFTHVAPDFSGFSSETRASMSLGLGYQWLFADGRLALRAEARAQFVLVNSSRDFLCSGGCVVNISGDVLTQTDAMLGLQWRF
jgi:hypothetical protein